MCAIYWPSARITLCSSVLHLNPALFFHLCMQTWWFARENLEKLSEWKDSIRHTHTHTRAYDRLTFFFSRYSPSPAITCNANKFASMSNTWAPYNNRELGDLSLSPLLVCTQHRYIPAFRIRSNSVYYYDTHKIGEKEKQIWYFFLFHSFLYCLLALFWPSFAGQLQIGELWLTSLSLLTESRTD